MCKKNSLRRVTTVTKFHTFILALLSYRKNQDLGGISEIMVPMEMMVGMAKMAPTGPARR